MEEAYLVGAVSTSPNRVSRVFKSVLFPYHPAVLDCSPQEEVPESMAKNNS